MDLVVGRKLLDALRSQVAAEARRRGMSAADLEAELLGKPPPSSAYMAWAGFCVRAADIASNLPRRFWNAATGWLAPSRRLALVHSDRPVDIRWVLQLIS